MSDSDDTDLQTKLELSAQVELISFSILFWSFSENTFVLPAWEKVVKRERVSYKENQRTQKRGGKFSKN